jgi:magnesium chelatase subunit D
VLESPRRRERLQQARSGRRTHAVVDSGRGKYARHRLAAATDFDIAFDATVRAAILRGAPIQVEEGDLRRKVRRHRSPYAVCFVVDNSWSVHAERMIEKVKGLVFELLSDAAGRGDRVALVAFRGGVAEGSVVLPLTKSVTLARRRLAQIPLSGQTPLADAMRRGRLLLRRERFRHANALPILVVVSDGLPTVPLRRGGDPVLDVLREARALHRERIACVIADASPPGAPSCGPELARLSGGRLVPVAELV